MLGLQQTVTYERAIGWDLDKTLTNDHWHQALVEAGISPGNGDRYFDALMRGLPIGSSDVTLKAPGLKNPKETSLAMKRALNKGIGVAIVSFTHFPEVIKPILNYLTQYADIGGLTPTDVDRIFIRGGFPSDNNPNQTPMGKKEHLLDVMQHFGISHKENLLLVDDSRRNCLICRGVNPGDCQSIDQEAVGFQAIEVPAYPASSLDYIDRINTFIAPYRQEELALAPEEDFLHALAFVCDKLQTLNLTTARRRGFKLNEVDPIDSIVDGLQEINALQITASEKKHVLFESLRRHRNSAQPREQKIIDSVQSEYKPTSASTASRLRD